MVSTMDSQKQQTKAVNETSDTRLNLNVVETNSLPIVEPSKSTSDIPLTNDQGTEDEFGKDDVLEFDELEDIENRTDSLLGALKNEMDKQGIEVKDIQEPIVSENMDNKANNEPSSDATNGNDKQEEEMVPDEPTVTFTLQELIQMVKDEIKQKVTEPEDKFTSRSNQLTTMVDEYLSLDPKDSEPEELKTFIAVKIEEIQSSKCAEKAINRWRELIEDIDDKIRSMKAKQAHKDDVRKKVKELKEKKETIPYELTTKAHAKKQAEINNAKKEIKKLRKKIDQMQSREISLNDMDEDSAYIREDRYRRRLLNLTKKVEKLQGYTRRDYRPLFRPIKYTESAYADINDAVSKKVTKLIKGKKLDSQTQKRGVNPDFVDIVEIVRSTDSGQNMSEAEVDEESKVIFKNIIDEMRSRRTQEAEEFFDQYESDEDLGVIDVHEATDEELEKKLLPLEKVKESIDKAVEEFEAKVNTMTEEEKAKIEEEEEKEIEEDEKAIADDEEDLKSDDELDEELDEEGDEDLSEGKNPDGSTAQQKDDSDDDDDDDDVENEEIEQVDLSSDEENEESATNESKEKIGIASGSGDLVETPGSLNSVESGEKHGHDGEGEVGPPIKKLKKTTDDVEEITLSSDDEN